MEVWVLHVKVGHINEMRVYSTLHDAECALDSFVFNHWSTEDRGEIPAGFEERIERFFFYRNEYDLRQARIYPPSKDEEGYVWHE